ncbi:MAG: FAD-dependent oxidoreductase [Flavobacteriales bacterium]|nr:FAD-dependent oxidoreductase [Flavobacteriales bacterium]
MNIPQSGKKRVVIIGGGFAGLQVAKNLDDRYFQIVMVDRNNYHTFQPLLYQVATAGLEPDSIAYPLRKLFKGSKDFYFRMAEVEEVKTEENILQTNIGDVEYDYLVVATGATTNFFGNKELEANAMTMKSVSEALDLRSLILQNFEKALLKSAVEEQDALMSITIVGAGPTGVELSGALAELKKHVLPHDYPDLNINRMQVYLVEMADKVLPPMSEHASRKALKYLQDLGVEVILGEAVKEYKNDKVILSSGKKLNAGMLIWAAGVKGNLLNGLKEESVKKGRYQVDRFHLIEGEKNVFAIGDIAYMETAEFPMGLPMVAPVANQSGVNLAKNLNKSQKNKTTKEFTYKDKGAMATVGRNRAVADLNNLKFGGLAAWLVWMFVHLLTLVGFRNRLVTFFNWSYNYFNFDRGIRLIIRKYEKKNLEPRS